MISSFLTPCPRYLKIVASRHQQSSAAISVPVLFLFCFGSYYHLYFDGWDCYAVLSPVAHPAFHANMVVISHSQCTFSVLSFLLALTHLICSFSCCDYTPKSWKISSSAVERLWNFLWFGFISFMIFLKIMKLQYCVRAIITISTLWVSTLSFWLSFWN